MANEMISALAKPEMFPWTGRDIGGAERSLMMNTICWNGMMADEFSPASIASEFKVHILSKPQKYSRAFKKILEYLNGIFFHKSWILILNSQEPLFGASRFVTLTIIFNSWRHETCFLTRSTMKYTVLSRFQSPDFVF